MCVLRREQISRGDDKWLLKCCEAKEQNPRHIVGFSCVLPFSFPTLFINLPFYLLTEREVQERRSQTTEIKILRAVGGFKLADKIKNYDIEPIQHL
jgi:hypothetical protein